MRAWYWLLLCGVSFAVGAQELRVVGGLQNPEGVLVGPDGRIYVTEVGEYHKPDDGDIMVITEDGKLEPITTFTLNDPRGMAAYRNYVFVADGDHVYKINHRGRKTEHATVSEFPREPQFLHDLAADAAGNLYVSDTGDIEHGGGGAIFKISPIGEISLVISEDRDARIKSPSGLLVEDARHLLVLDFFTGDLLRLDLQTLQVEKVMGGFGNAESLVRDKRGTLYVSDWKGGRVWSVDMTQTPPVSRLYDHKFELAGDIALTADEQFILVPDFTAGTVTWLPVQH
ncbi:MAG: hypothetical protein AB1513_03250 [Pseudomonadota bacterium]